MRRNSLAILAILALIALAAAIGFMTIGARGSWSFILSFRGTKLLGMVLVGYAIALSTVLFQTITNNRITLTAKSAEVNGEAEILAKALSAEWRTLVELNRLPFSSAHAKLRSHLQP